MKRMLVLTLIVLTLVALAAPTAFAQAPAPKVTINGLIDNVTSYSQNIANYNTGVFNRKDSLWYARARGRFDIIGEVGKAKGVIGFEMDLAYGQTGSRDSSVAPAGATTGTAVQQAFATNGGFDLNTDVGGGQLELKWLYVEFPVPLIPVPTTARVGAQSFGAAATYKLATYATGDFAGVNVTSQVTPNLKVLATYVQAEENLVGTGTRSGLPAAGVAPTQNRGDDFAYILSAEITPFKGLDIKPVFSMFYAAGTTSGPFGSRQGRGGVNITTAYTNPDGTSHGGINEYRYTVGADARLRMGPFSFDPTVLYQFGSRTVVGPQATTAIIGPAFVSSGAVPGRKYYANIDAWLIDLRAGFQLGPLLIEGLGMYTTGNRARNNTLGTVRYFQVLDADTGYLSDWGTQLTSLGLDYQNALNEASTRVAYPGNTIGWDKYGRAQIGLKATYAITPALSAMAGANGHWTAQEVDRNGIPVAGAGIVPTFTGNRPRDGSRYVGTELMALVSYRFAPGLVWDNAAGYMFMGEALDAVTDPTLGGRNTNNPFIYTSRLRFTF